MRYSSLLPLAAVAATGFVIPDETTSQQLAFVDQQEATSPDLSWMDDGLSMFAKFRSTVEDAIFGVGQLLDDISEAALPLNWNVDLPDFLPEWALPRKGPHGHHGHHGATNLTIYQAIKTSNYTTKFAELVDEFPDLVAALNSTSHNLTLFVPTNKAFEKIPEDHKKPPAEFIEKFLKYHLVPGFYSGIKVLHARTLPTLLEETALGGNPQRLRISLDLKGLHLNFYSRVIVHDIVTANGVIHGLDHLLVPPPPALHLISLFPQIFSTVTLAAEKTGLAKELLALKTTGETLFVPTNHAFAKLGPAANAFLFNTQKGLGYLKALLKYHAVIDETLYSDAYYGRDSSSSSTGVDFGGSEHFHVDLPTLLADKSLSIDVASWGRLLTIKINGRTHVAVADGISRNGVVHVVPSVLIPPHEHKDRDAYADGDEITVEELVERLEPYLEKGQEDVSMGEL